MPFGDESPRVSVEARDETNKGKKGRKAEGIEPSEF
jgi:hypothetical protein